MAPTILHTSTSTTQQRYIRHVLRYPYSTCLHFFLYEHIYKCTNVRIFVPPLNFPLDSSFIWTWATIHIFLYTFAHSFVVIYVLLYFIPADNHTSVALWLTPRELKKIEENKTCSTSHVDFQLVGRKSFSFIFF